MVENSFKSMRIWEYSPVADGEKTAADQCESGNIHQSNQEKQL
jgi:hypothetical protein